MLFLNITEIGNLTRLTYLDLWINQLTGTIPSGVCNFLELIVLRNFVTCSFIVSAELQKLTALTSLNLYSNRLTGTIPSGMHIQ